MSFSAIQSHAQVNLVTPIFGITTVYNEAMCVDGVIESIARWKAKGKYGHLLKKWVFVDDESKLDNSWQRLEIAALKRSFIKSIKITHSGKAAAYKAAAKYLSKKYPNIKDAIIVQLDADILKLTPKHFDRLIVGLLKPNRIASFAFVPPQRGNWVKFRQWLTRTAARNNFSITGQRAYYGDTLNEAFPQITELTGFGLENLINDCLKEKFKETCKGRKFKHCISSTQWIEVNHITNQQKQERYMQKIIPKRHPLLIPLSFFVSGFHYIALGFYYVFGFLFRRGGKNRSKRSN